MKKLRAQQEEQKEKTEQKGWEMSVEWGGAGTRPWRVLSLTAFHLPCRMSPFSLQRLGWKAGKKEVFPLATDPWTFGR